MPTLPFNLLIVAQGGRLQYEALLFTAALRETAPHLLPHLHIAEPQPGPLWPEDPRMSPAVRDWLKEQGAQLCPFESQHFGQDYPYGNKIEALRCLPPNENFIFFDTDTLLLQDLSKLEIPFATPSASVKVEGTWPEPQPYVATLRAIWQSLYERFGLDITATLNPRRSPEHWEHYLYFNAGWFFGPCPQAFGERFTRYALEIRTTPGDILAAQTLTPWLDQVALPLVITAFGGGRPPTELAGLDGAVSHHYRTLPLLYASAPDATLDFLERISADKPLKRLLRDWEPAKKLIYQGKGRSKVRPLFDQENLPLREEVFRKTLRKEGWWMR